MKNKKNEHEIILKVQKERFYLYIPELCIYVEGDDLNIAYQDIVKQKEVLLLNLENRQFGDYDASKYSKNNDSKIFKDILPFLTKYTLLALILLMFIFVSTSFIANKVSQISLVEIMKNQARQIISIADRQLFEISDEEKKKRIEKFSRFSKDLMPYIEAFHN